MPNWCYTKYCFYGDSAAIKTLGKDIKRFTSKNYRENDFGKNWLGNVLLGYGFAYEGNSFSFRGSILDMEEGKDCLFLSTETAWAPMPEMWDAIFEKHFKAEDETILISYVFLSEEPGCALYVNTDMSGQIFPERYLLELGELPEKEDCETFYMRDEQEVIKTVNEIFRVTHSTFAETKAFLKKKQMQIRQEAKPGFLSFHTYATEY